MPCASLLFDGKQGHRGPRSSRSASRLYREPLSMGCSGPIETWSRWGIHLNTTMRRPDVAKPSGSTACGWRGRHATAAVAAVPPPRQRTGRIRRSFRPRSGGASWSRRAWRWPPTGAARAARTALWRYCQQRTATAHRRTMDGVKSFTSRQSSRPKT